MRYTYKVIVKSEHPKTIITDKLDKIADSFTIIETIEEVNDETPPDKKIIKEIPFLYV